MQTDVTGFWNRRHHFATERGCLDSIIELKWPEGVRLQRFGYKRCGNLAQNKALSPCYYPLTVFLPVVLSSCGSLACHQVHKLKAFRLSNRQQHFETKRFALEYGLLLAVGFYTHIEYLKPTAVMWLLAIAVRARRQNEFIGLYLGWFGFQSETGAWCLLTSLHPINEVAQNAKG